MNKGQNEKLKNSVGSDKKTSLPKAIVSVGEIVGNEGKQH